ncbi:hypothetical protein ACSBR2_011400 [Camellia fascicularis]
MMLTTSSSSPEDLSVPLIPPSKKADEPIAGKQKLSVDDMLNRFCGEFGIWQLRHFVLTSLAWALEALHTMVMIFADREPEWRCLIPGSCSTGSGIVCGLEPGSWEWVGGPASATVAEWGLVCGQKYKVGLVQSLFFGGCMIGAGIFGHLSDSILGRKGSLMVVCILNAIFGCLTALAPNFYTCILIRFLTGFSTGGIGLCALVLAIEPVGLSKRGIAGIPTFYFFSTEIAFVSGIAYLFQSWRALYIATSIPSILFLVIILPFISESPRWFLIRGKTNEAMKIMQNIVKVNEKHFSEDISLALDEEANKPTTTNKVNICKL